MNPEDRLSPRWPRRTPAADVTEARRRAEEAEELELLGPLEDYAWNTLLPQWLSVARDHVITASARPADPAATEHLRRARHELAVVVQNIDEVVYCAEVRNHAPPGHR